MAKTSRKEPAGTDDSTPQPTQKTTPAKREDRAIEKEDHSKKREMFSEEERKK
jgi:hypothetical protein